MSVRDVTCREAIDVLGDYLEETLATDERLGFERHLAACETCVRYLATYEHTIRATRDAGDDDRDAPTDIPNDLVQAILAARRRTN